MAASAVDLSDCFATFFSFDKSNTPDVATTPQAIPNEAAEVYVEYEINQSDVFGIKAGEIDLTNLSYL